MKKIILILTVIFISFNGYSQVKDDVFRKYDDNTLAIEKTTEITYTRDEIRQRIREYDKAIKSLCEQRQIQIDLEAKCMELKIDTTAANGFNFAPNFSHGAITTTTTTTPVINTGPIPTKVKPKKVIKKAVK